jgi:O-acetyl-ADP-ribose deacetylase (regulator of RNase III)
MIIYKKNDIFEQVQKHDIIAHICNNKGKFGAGFSGELAKKFPESIQSYLSHIKVMEKLEIPTLGTIHIKKYPIKKHTIVDMIAMDGVRSKINIVPLRYQALEKCLQTLRDYLEFNFINAAIKMPKIGSGLAGGDWNKIVEIIDKIFKRYRILIYEK